jgi:hypothetical protein
MVLVQAKVMDSTHLELSRPIAASCGVKVFVIVAESANTDAERQQWLEGSAESIGRAYGDSEPDYTQAMVREANLDYSA